MIHDVIRYSTRLGLRRIASIPADLAFRLTNFPPVMEHLEKRHNATLRLNGNGSEIEQAAVAQLEQTGVFVTDLPSIGCSTDDISELLTSGKQLAALLARRADAGGKVRPAVTVSEPRDLMNFPNIYRWGLHPIILGIVKAYLRAPVAYDGPLVFHAAADGRETGSRRWHQDREDRRVVKVGLYLNDVSDSGGPFQLVNHELRGAREPFHYKALDSRRLEQKLGHDVVSSSTITCPGKAGTLFFAETGRFYHRGKPATEAERSTIFFSYFAQSPRHPFYCARSGLSQQHITTLIEGLSQEQRAAALWRDALPLAIRLIPPSLM